MFLLDTDIVIYCIKKRPPVVLSKLRKKRPPDISISAITIAELEFGVENSNFPEKNRIALLEFLSIFTVVPFDDKDAQAYGRIKADLRKKGRMIGPMDLLIAAQAKAKDMILVTNNSSEFERIAGLEVENWTRPGSGR